MASLRSNVLLSSVAMVVIGATRPAFNAVVNRVFGSEVNGWAATIIALVFLASIPATAALPTVTVRHVSRALGEGLTAESRSYIRLGAKSAAVLMLVGLALALASKAGAGRSELLVVIAGTAAYCYWRLFRTVLLAVGLTAFSLKAEIIGFVGFAGALAAIVVVGHPDLSAAVFFVAYALFALVTLPKVIPLLRKADPLPAERRASFLKYNGYWFLGAGASLAARELSLLILDARTDRALVGEFSVALSLLMFLALAPRIIELPLVHELSSLAGRRDIDEQRALAAKALHWLTVATFALGGAVAILAGPILLIVGGVDNAAITLAFTLVVVGFSVEMAVTPAANLLVAESPPAVLSMIGVASLAAAGLWWVSPAGSGVIGIAAGLAASYIVKGIGIAWYARSRYGLPLFEKPWHKLALILGGSGLVVLTRAGWSSWGSALGFVALALGLFRRELSEMLTAVTSRSGPGPLAPVVDSKT